MTIPELYNLFTASSGISTDTRSIQDGNLFFGLNGANFNGNAYAQQALDTGAAYAIIDETAYDSSAKTILVADVLTTLQDLARHHRKQLSIPVIGITGSNGKTTTKELSHAVLSKKYNTFATKGNLNNHIGVPLSVLSITSDHEMAIIEMGANHVGEIADLCTISQPDYGLITNVGTAHIEGFGSQENIYTAKSELYDWIRDTDSKGVFVCQDLEYLMDLSKGIRQITYGLGSAFFSGKIISGSYHLKLSISDAEDEVNVNTQIVGNYNFTNALAAGCIGRFFNVPLRSIKEALENYSPANNRSQYLEKGGNSFILDAYNANPSSVKAALKHFESINHPKKMVVLGDMLELGETSNTEHKAIVQKVRVADYAQAIFVGPEFQSFVRSPELHFSSVGELKEWWAQHSNQDYLVLVKGSRGIKLEQLVE